MANISGVKRLRHNACAKNNAQIQNYFDLRIMVLSIGLLTTILSFGTTRCSPSNFSKWSTSSRRSPSFMSFMMHFLEALFFEAQNLDSSPPISEIEYAR